MFWTYLLSYKNNLRLKFVSQAGFGLVELMVSISIMAIVSGIIFTNQSSYNGAVLLRGEAYDMALQTREIQLSAVSALGAGGGTVSFRSVYGLYFDTANDDEYVIFKDSLSGADKNNSFDLGEEFGTQGRLDSRFEIRDIRKVSGATETSVSNINVIFVRPNFDATFYDGSGTLLNISSIEIDISRRGNTGTGNGDVRTIEITASGQIAVLPI